MTEANVEGWQWFGSPGVPPRDDTARQFNECFATPAGKAVLAHLRRHFIERRLPASATAEALRHLEGGRCAIAYIERLAAPLAPSLRDQAND